VEQLVRAKLLIHRSDKLGYRAPESAVVEAMRQEPAFQVDGKYSPEAARGRLAQAGISEPVYERQLSEDLQREQLEQGIRESNFLTAAERDRLNTLQHEQREVRYAIFSGDSFAGTGPVDEATLDEYYKRHQQDFKTPESVKLQYAELSLDRIASQVQVSDADLKSYYDQNKDRFNVPEKRHAHHILIEHGSDDAAALKKAQGIYEQIKAGKDFETLARQNSADAGSAARGGDLGWAERGYYEPAFADALFAMKPGEVRGPVKTQYGYHIIRLDEVQAGRTQSFEEARAEIESNLRRERAGDRYGELQEQLQQKMEQQPSDLEAVAKQLGLETGIVDSFESGGGGPPLGNSAELERLVFSDPVLLEHKLGGPVALGEGRLVILKALEHREAKLRPLSEVREQVASGVRKDRGSKASFAAAQAAAQKLESGVAFDAALKGLPVKAEPTTFVGRQDTTVPGAVVQMAFGSRRPDPAHPIIRALQTPDGGAVLVEVLGGRVDSLNQTEQLQARIRQDAQREGAGDFSAYVEETRRLAEVQKNPSALN